jgi:hypothetical protein
MKMLLAFVVLSAACGDDGAPRSAPEETKPIAATPKPKPGPIDLSLAAGFEMRHPVRDGDVVIVPIVATAAIPDVHYVTLADGLAAHKVTVREIARGENFQVDHVRIRNKGMEPLFVMTGELIYDGLQDRAMAEDRIIAPGEKVDVAVRCVEQGREAGHMEFHASGVLAEIGLRQKILYAEQQDVWAKVEAINTAHHLTPATRTYRDAAELQHATAAAARRDGLARQLAALPDRDKLVGLALITGGRVVELDRFATPELYGRLEALLLGSYLASDGLPPHEGHNPVPADVRAFVSDSWAQGARTTAASYTAVVRQ